MKHILNILLILFLFSCENKPIEDKKSLKISDSHTTAKRFDAFYDIVDLKKFNDPSKFIARLRFLPAFSAKSIIEPDEIADGIDLYAKQPEALPNPSDTMKPLKSLPFNQLCYWYADKDAEEIKNLFLKYPDGIVKEDYRCSDCFDGDFRQVGIYNHGKYSSLRKDFMTKNDSSVIGQILLEVNLLKENGYRI